MIKQTAYFIAAILLSAVVLHAQQPDDAPFAVVERAVREDSGSWAGNKERLSTIFDVERNRLGSRFEGELLKWIGNDVERHYWVSLFLENNGYLHGNKRLPELSLLIKQQGLSLLTGLKDEKSYGYVVGLSISAAILSDELGLGPLAGSYKLEAEALVRRYPSLAAHIPAMSDAERYRYDQIRMRLTPAVAIADPARVGVTTGHPTVIGSGSDSGPRAPIMGGVINGRALKLVKPEYPRSARESGAQGPVAVQVLIDETGKVISAKAISGHPDLRKASEDAALQSEFSPTRLAGQPVKVTGTVMYNFVRN